MPPAVGGGSRTSPGGWDKEGGGGSTTTTGTSTSSSTSGAAAYRSAMGPAAATAGSAEDEQNLLDWIGDSVKSAVDSIFVLPGAEDGSTAVNGGNAVPSASSSLLRASGITSAASGESGGAARTKIVKGLRRGTAAAGAGSSGDSGNARTRNKSSVSFGSSAPSPWSAGTSTTGTSSTGAGATRGVSSTAYASSAGSPASTGTASAAATRTAKRGSLSPPSDTSSPIGTGASRTTTASTAMRKQKYKRAQSSPPPSTGLSVDESAQRKTKRTAKGGGILQRSSTTIIDSIGSIGRGGDYTGSSSAPAAAAKRKLNRRLSEQYAEREAGGADVIATTICKSSSLDDEGGVKRLSKLPPLPPKASRKADASWTAIHDMLIDELFEESRREYLSKQHRSAHGQEKADHRHHGDRKDAKLGWKIGHFLHPGGGGGGGHGADGVHIISDDKSQRSSSKAAKKDDVTSPFFSPEGASKRGGGSKDVANGGGIFSGLPWTSSTDANQGKKSRSRLRLKRPISFRRRKEREEESERGGLAASVSAAVAAAAAAVTSSAGATSHNSSDGAPSSPPDKHQKDAKAPTESAASSPFLPRISRLSPSKRRVLGGSARGNAFQQGSPIRSTGDYTGRSDPNPGTYLHPQCRLQKDKGRGEVPGTAAIVASREGSLEKIRAKVDVIIEVEQSGSTTSSRAKLRLKPAVLVDSYSDGIIETRSVISVKMGFLFLKYGILLRWDADSGLVNLIVLRKMCSPGFLDGNDASVAVDKKSNVVEADAARGSASSPSTSLSRQTLLKSNSAKRSKRSVNGSPSKHGFVIGRLVDGANAILHGRWDSESNGGGTEVAHLGPPYLVDRPDQFAGASLSVTVLKASGLCAGESKRSDWAMNPYVRLSIGPESHRTKAVKMTTSPTWTMSTNNSCRLAVSNNPRDDDQHLKVELYDWRPFRRDRILGVVFVPVASVEPQKGNDAGGNDDRADERDALQATEVTIPVRMMRNKKGPYGCVTMSLIHRNDHLCWLKEELKARGKNSTSV